MHNKIVDQKIGPNEKRALKLLEPFTKQLTLCSDGERSLIRIAQAAIRRGTFNKLPGKLVKLAKTQTKEPKKPAALLDHILAILQEYPLRAEEDPDAQLYSQITGLSSSELKPEIILSESFVFEKQ